jgi:hypothetical protein
MLSSLAAIAWLGFFSLPPAFAASTSDPPVKPSDPSAKPNFSGNWRLDLNASTSLEPLMTQIGASYIERKYADTVTLKATLSQTEKDLTLAVRGPAFAFDETLFLDGRSSPGSLKLLGATSLKTTTAWSKDQKQLVATYLIKTNQGKTGQLTIKRYLVDDGKTLVATYHLKIDADPNTTDARQIWRKQA